MTKPLAWTEVRVHVPQGHESVRTFVPTAEDTPELRDPLHTALTDLARDNGIKDLCTFRQGGFEVLTADDGPFEVVLANIYSDVIQAEAGNLERRLAPGGWFAFSGCPLHHANTTRVAIVEAGLSIEEERLLGRWMTFVGGAS